MKRVPLGPETVPGIDTSYAQQAINVAEVKASGIKYIIAKCTEAISIVDSQFAHTKLGCLANDMPLIPYLFWRPGIDPIAQAEHFLANAHLKSGDMVPMLDVEVAHGPQDIPNLKALLSHVKQKIGADMIFYSMPDHVQNVLKLDSSFKQYALYIANPGGSAPEIPPPWEIATFWQNSWKGSVTGVRTVVDTDLFNGPMSQLLKFKIP